MIPVLMDLDNKERTELLERAKAEGYRAPPWYCDTDTQAIELEIAELERQLQEIEKQLASCSDDERGWMLQDDRSDLRADIYACRQQLENVIAQTPDEWLLIAYVEERLMNVKRLFDDDIVEEAYSEGVLSVARIGSDRLQINIDVHDEKLGKQISKLKDQQTKHIAMNGSPSLNLHLEMQRLIGEADAYFMSTDVLNEFLRLSNLPWKRVPKLVDAFVERFQRGEIPKPFTLSGAFHGLELGPGEITVLGGTPGIGKTAAAMQIVSELRRNHPDLPICIANAESSFDSMLMREIGREMTIPSSKIRRSDLTDEEKAKVVETAMKLKDSMKNIEWLSSEFNYVQICAITNKQPGLLVCDYLQKFAPSDQETRVGITMVMSALRQLAASGWAVLALSALNRTTIGQATTLAAFRDSSEIEYQSDAAYVLERMIKDDIEFVRLRCLKNRHDKPADISMDYHAATMEFTERFHEMGETADNLWGADDDQ